jgi:hypothetical protein
MQRSRFFARIASAAAVLALGLASTVAHAEEKETTITLMGVLSSGTVEIHFKDTLTQKDPSDKNKVLNCNDTKGYSSHLAFVSKDAEGREDLLSIALAAKLSGSPVTVVWARDPTNGNCYVSKLLIK